MGSCSTEQHSGKGLDSTVGGLVWVRRGNGSWWPGQIVDANEVSTVPNTSDVPIKLLGRDDVNVEWYNLKMTKKVRAFRSEEHTSCIEKAKAYSVNPVKKRAKYVRKENAILLALDLETSLISKACDDCSGADNFKSGPNLRCSESSLIKSNQTVVLGLESRSFKEKSDSAPELSHSGISFEEANTDKIRRQRTPNDSEDDDNEGIKKRMKGLDDLGMGSTKSLVTESAPQVVALVSDLSASSCLPARQHLVNGSRGGCMSFFRKKRSKVLFHDILKRKNRRRMLTKVLQSDTLVSIPVFDGLPSPCKSFNYNVKVSGFESNDPKGSPSAALLCNNDDNNDSNCPEISFEDAPSMNGSEVAQDADHDISSLSELLGFDSLENWFDVPLICEAEFSDGSPLLTSQLLKPQNGSSRGHMPGKSPVEVGAETTEVQEDYGRTAASAAVHVNNHLQKTERGPSEWQLKGRRKARHQNRNAGPDIKIEPKPEMTDTENILDQYLPSQHKLFSYRQSWYPLLPRYEIPELSVIRPSMDSVLYDVHIEVKAGINRPQQQHVPYISLMSKLNGKPITGHPVTVEILEDGECDFLLTDDDEVAGLNEDGDEPVEPRKKEMVLKPFFSPSKSPKNKKQGGSCSKKTRRLSALTRANNCRERMVVIRNLKAPALACIPLKVVFSRINEALNGSSRCNRGS